MAGTSVVLLFMLVSSSTAFFYRRNNLVAVANGRPVEQSCLNLAEQGSCEFYTCFENRLPCGRNWYMLRTGLYYCNKMQRERHNFSPEGQHFLNDSQRCLTRSLKDLYQRDYVDCHDLEHAAVAAITPCFIDNAFCDVLEEDASRFFDIYEFSDLFTVGAGKVWRTIVNLATRCGVEAIRELSSNAGETVVDSVNSAFQNLGNSVNE